MSIYRNMYTVGAGLPKVMKKWLKEGTVCVCVCVNFEIFSQLWIDWLIFQASNKSTKTLVHRNLSFHQPLWLVNQFLQRLLFSFSRLYFSYCKSTPFGCGHAYHYKLTGVAIFFTKCYITKFFIKTMNCTLFSIIIIIIIIYINLAIKIRCITL